MDFSSVLPYLKGKKFSNGLEFNPQKIRLKYVVSNRVTKPISKRKRVIHLGCADHLPLIDKNS